MTTKNAQSVNSGTEDPAQRDAKLIVRELIDEFREAKIDARPGMLTGSRRTGPQANLQIWTGSTPPRVEVIVTQGEHFFWHVADRDHGHRLPIQTSVADAAELIAICFARQCVGVSKLNQTRVETPANTASKHVAPKKTGQRK